MRAPLPASAFMRICLALAIALASVARTASAQDSVRTIVRTMFGDVALELRVTGQGMLSIGAADSSRAVTLDVRATDARRWVDSAQRLVALGARRIRAVKGGLDTSVTRRRVVLEEPGVGAGSFILVRTDSGGSASYVLFASDADFGGVRQQLDAEEASTLVSIVRRAAILASQPRRRTPKPLPGRPRALTQATLERFTQAAPPP